MSVESVTPSWIIAVVGVVVTSVIYFFLGSNPRNIRSVRWSQTVVAGLVLCFLAGAAYGRYHARDLVSKADALAATGDIRHAIVDYDRAIAISPVNARAYL